MFIIVANDTIITVLYDCFKKAPNVHFNNERYVSQIRSVNSIVNLINLI